MIFGALFEDRFETEFSQKMRMKHTQVAWTERISTQLVVPALSPPRTTSQFIDLSSPQSNSRVQRVYVVPVDEPKPKEKIASSDLLIQRRCIVAGIDAAKSVMKHRSTCPTESGATHSKQSLLRETLICTSFLFDMYWA